MKKIEEGPLQDRRKAQAKRKQSMDLLRRKQAQQRMAAARTAKEKEKTDIAARRGLRAAQASKHAQKNWRQEDVGEDVKLPTSAENDAAFRKYEKRRKKEIKRQKLAKAWAQHDAAMKKMDRERKYRKEDHDCNETHPGMTHKEWVEDQKIEATYSERISSDVPEGNASGAAGTSKKKRKFRQVTPGQVRDYEKLSAARMFQAYEQKTDEEGEGPPATNTSGIAKYPTILFKTRRKIDGRSKDYKETVQRVQARRDALAARELEQKLNMFGVQSNPFREETEMNNKKYLTTKEGSIESAVLESLTTETPVNPNDAKPTLHLPEKKYLQIKKGSLENAVSDVMTEKKKPGYKLPRQLIDKDREKMVGVTDPKTGKVHTKVVDKKDKRYDKHPLHASVEYESAGVVKSGHGKDYDKDGDIDSKDYMKARDIAIKKTKARIKNRLQPESAGARGERDIGSQAYTDYVKNLTPGEGDSSIVDRDAQKSAKASQETNKEKKLRSTRIDDEYIAEKEVDVKDTRRTVDAIRAYDRSKDASRDADWDTEHGKKKKGDKEKKYAKKERGEIDKDDPDWKHKKYHTGMHGEERSAADAALLDKAKRRHAQDKRERDTEKLPAPKSEGVKHDCASHVKHEEHGMGKCLPGQHTIVETEDGEGYVTHYDVMFDSTIVKDIPVEELEILERWPHTHGKKGVKENNIPDDDYDHATALYKDQWKDRKIADYDKEHGRDSRAKEMRADAGEDRKRMYGLTKDKWKHAKYATGEEEGKKSETGNTPDPKDAYKEEISSLVSASVRTIRQMDEKDWIKGAIKKPGALRKSLDVPAGENIPASKLAAAAKKGGKLGQRARLAQTLKKMHNEFVPEEVEEVLEITSLDDLVGVDHHEYGFETRADMVEFALNQLEGLQIKYTGNPTANQGPRAGSKAHGIRQAYRASAPKSGGRMAGAHTHEDMGRSVKEPAVSDKDVEAFKKKNPEKYKVVKPQGTPRWAKKQYQKSEDVELDEVGDTKAGRQDLKHYIQKRVGDVRTAKTDKKSKQHQKGIQRAAARIGFWEPKS